MAIPKTWLAAYGVCGLAVAMTAVVWLSEEDSIATFVRWPLHKVFPLGAATNVVLLALAGVAYAVCSPTRRSPPSSSARPLLPLQARTVIFYVWLALNTFWFVAGIRERDFSKKPKWLRRPNPSTHPDSTAVASPTALSHSYVPLYGDGALHALRLSYGVGMAAAWPLLANLFVVLLPADRSLFLLSCLGVGHEDGVLAHALCGTAVWVWASAHAVLTQLPMLAAGLWRVIMLPPLDGTETKGASNCMGLLAWLCLCVLGATSLAPLRRRSFNAFQRLHLVLGPAVLLLGCLHDSKVFWYGMLGAVLYGADLVQRWAVRRRSAVAVATVYPLPAGPLTTTTATTTTTTTTAAGGSPLLASALAMATQAAAVAALSVPEDIISSTGGGGGDGSKFVVLRIPTRGPPGCCAGQHVWIKVPQVSPWEWHPYSVAAHDDLSFALVVKAGGDWERRLCRLVERTAARARHRYHHHHHHHRYHKGGRELSAADGSALLDVQYEGLYGTPDLGVAAAAADRVLLFAGGAGITPVASVLQSLLLRTPPADGPTSMTSLPSALPPPLPAEEVLGGVGGRGEAAAAAHGGCSGVRVQLVWAVTQLADAQPLMPLLRSAAARPGWRVDIHCTRAAAVAAANVPATELLPPAGPQGGMVVVACPPAAGWGPLATLPPPVLTPSSSPEQEGKGAERMAERAGAATACQLWQQRPWQLSGAACWAVAAAAAAAAAVGRNLGSALAETYSCAVAAADGDGVVAWAAAVRAAFQEASGLGAAAAVAAAASGGGFGAGWLTSRALGALARGLSLALLGSGGFGGGPCPASLDAGRHLLSMAQDDGGAGDGTDSTAAVVTAPTHHHHDHHLVKAGTHIAHKFALRVCRTTLLAWRRPSLELCVKCDPFVPRSSSPLERAWPCCTASACFFAPRLALLLGWLLGGLAGALLACWVWRRWAAARARAAGKGGHHGAGAAAATDACSRRRWLWGPGALAQRAGHAGGGRWGMVAARQAAGANSYESSLLSRMGQGASGGCGGVVSSGCGYHDALAAAEEGGGGAGGDGAAAPGGPVVWRAAPGLEGMVGCVGGAEQGPPGASPSAGGDSAVRVHVGRPDVDSYIRTAVAAAEGGLRRDAGAATHPEGRGRGFGTAVAAGGGLVYGVVVCGPESLQAAVQAAYERHVAAPGHRGSWFRGFSFTT